jgi:hypothetical protein
MEKPLDGADCRVRFERRQFAESFVIFQRTLFAVQPQRHHDYETLFPFATFDFIRLRLVNKLLF